MQTQEAHQARKKQKTKKEWKLKGQQQNQVESKMQEKQGVDQESQEGQQEQTYLHWRLETDSNSLLWLFIDKQGASANTIDQPLLAELEQILIKIEHDKTLKGVIIASAKPSGFIAGANIEKFTSFKTVEEAQDFIRYGQMVFQRLARLPIPTVAVIEGFCLGGGLEFALACRYRIADDSSKTRLGLPEVLLGIHPGWGGSVRLPHLIGAIDAFDLILSGRTVSGKTAEKLGFVDAVVPRRHLKQAAIHFVHDKPKVHQATFLQGLTNLNVMRPLIGKILHTRLTQKAQQEHYPAPYAVLQNWVEQGVRGEGPYVTEAKSIAKLMLTESAQNLVRVFFLQERLKGLGKVGKGSQHTLKHLHVVGAGVMGGDIAAWSALRGLTVTLQDELPAKISASIQRAYKLFSKQLRDPRLVQETLDRLIPDEKGLGLAKADIVIEAVFEAIKVKHDVLKLIESQARKDAILATNTSSIPLDQLNTALTQPERLVGIHFFNPVSKMRLVEVVSGQATSDDVRKQALAFVRKIDRLPLPVKSSPGFLVNRILLPYLLESLLLYREGKSPVLIDKAAVDFGMPMGPIELADTVGLDVCLLVAKHHVEYYGGTIPEILHQKVQSGELGLKTGKGFYQYRNGEAVKTMPSSFDTATFQVITNRLILPMLNESVACLREGVVADPDLVDAGMVLGTGFAPFRGGPLQYARTVGKIKLKQILLQYETQLGERFKPDAGWDL